MARSTIVLGVIAAALLAFILLHERDMLSSGELEQRKNRVLATFVRDRVTRVEIKRAGESVVLERAPDPLQEDLLGPWKESAPLQVAVDQEAIDVLLGELEWLQPRRVIENLSAEDQKRFGFTTPRIEVRFNVGKQRSVLLIGNEEPTGLGLYARGDDPDVAFIVGKDLFEALDHDGGHFHTKELHKGVFVFAASAVSATVGAETRRAVLREASWWMDAPQKTLLNASEIEALIKGFDQLRAKRFVATKISGPETYGLNPPSAVLTVERGRTASDKKELATPVTLRVGAPCGAHAGEKFIQVDQGPIMCAADEDLAKLTQPLDALVDRSPFPVDPEQVTEVRMEHGGRVVALQKTEERWQVRAGEGAKTQERDADRQSVVEWMKALRSLSFVERSADATPPAGGELMSMTLKTSSASKGLMLRVRVDAAGFVHVLRGDEGVWLRFDAAAREPLTPFAARFRSLELIAETEGQLQELAVTRAGVTERVKRVSDRFALESPVVADADPVIVSEVEHLLSRLSAVRFAADAPEASHGLTQAAVRVAFKLGGAERTLSLGEATEGGVFAQLSGDGAVFVLPTRVFETLTHGLISRTALSVEAGRVSALRIEADGKSLRLKRDGERFVAVGATLEASAITAVVERLARLRAERLVRYGQAANDEGMERPRLRVVIESAAAAGAVSAVELTWGAAIAESEPALVLVRRNDIAATFAVAASTFERWLEPLK